MNHESHRVVEVASLGGYRLRLRFADGTIRDIDFEACLHGSLFAPLRDPDVFRAVRLDEEVGTIVWPNGADFDPDTLYNWTVTPPHYTQLQMA